MAQHFPAAGEKSGGEVDEDAASESSGFSAATSADNVELVSMRAQLAANTASRAAADNARSEAQIENDVLTKVLLRIVPALGNSAQGGGHATTAIDNSQLLANLQGLLNSSGDQQ